MIGLLFPKVKSTEIKKSWQNTYQKFSSINFNFIAARLLNQRLEIEDIVRIWIFDCAIFTRFSICFSTSKFCFPQKDIFTIILNVQKPWTIWLKQKDPKRKLLKEITCLSEKPRKTKKEGEKQRRRKAKKE